MRALVAIADVDAVVRKQTALDGHARQNTTSVYTVAAIFPMLPEKLSTDLTSLGPTVDRLAIVADLTFARDGSLLKSEHYPALVRNRAKLAYNSVAAWLDGTGPLPPALGAVAGLDANLRLQDELTQKLKSRRHQHGALDLETIQARPIFEGALLKDLVADTPNRAKTIIEDLMIAANGATARYLASRHRSSLRRVVRTPKHWNLIVELAAGRGATLPADPDAAALEGFLTAAKKADPLRFPDLSLSVIKLLGAGEYVLERPGGASAGHFGLAVRDYTHSDRAEPAVSGRDHPAAAEGGPGRPPCSLCGRRAGRAGQALHRGGGRGQEGGAAGHEVGGRPPAALAGGGAVRRPGDRRQRQGDLGARHAAAGRGAAGARIRRGEASGAALRVVSCLQRGRGPRLHRFQARGRSSGAGRG